MACCRRHVSTPQRTTRAAIPRRRPMRGPPAMAQIVHDIAPGANIDFYSAANSAETGFRQRHPRPRCGGRHGHLRRRQLYRRAVLSRPTSSPMRSRRSNSKSVIFVTCATNFGNEGYPEYLEPDCIDCLRRRDADRHAEFWRQPGAGRHHRQQRRRHPVHPGMEPALQHPCRRIRQTSLSSRSRTAAMSGPSARGEASNPFIALNLPVGTYPVIRRREPLGTEP